MKAYRSIPACLTAKAWTRESSLPRTPALRRYLTWEGYTDRFTRAYLDAFGSFISLLHPFHHPHPLQCSNPSPPEQLLQDRANDTSPVALVAASRSFSGASFLFSYEDSLEMLLFLSFLPPQTPSFREVTHWLLWQPRCTHQVVLCHFFL